MQTRLIAFGAVLLLLGALIMAQTFGSLPDAGAASPASQSLNSSGGPARLLPIAGGLALATGAALTGIGANRWYATRRGRNRTLR